MRSELHMLGAPSVILLFIPGPDRPVRRLHTYWSKVCTFRTSPALTTMPTGSFPPPLFDSRPNRESLTRCATKPLGKMNHILMFALPRGAVALQAPCPSLGVSRPPDSPASRLPIPRTPAKINIENRPQDTNSVSKSAQAKGIVLPERSK